VLTIETKAGYIFIKFTDQDFRRREEVESPAMDFIAEMKKAIPDKSKDLDGRDYDNERKEWIISDTAKNRGIIEALKIIHIDDPTQGKLF